MKWSNIKTWAKDQGYTSFREKTDNPDNPNQYDYYWCKDNDVRITGMTNSVSKLVTEIYNHITDNVFVQHQQTYKENLSKQDIDRDQGFGY
jgi:hypothetical protein